MRTEVLNINGAQVEVQITGHQLLVGHVDSYTSHATMAVNTFLCTAERAARRPLQSNLLVVRQVGTGELDLGIIPVRDGMAREMEQTSGGVSILAETHLDSRHDNTTFWLIGRGETQPTGYDLTTILVDGSTDALDRALGIIAFNKQRHAINMPPKGVAWVTLKGHHLDEPIQGTLAALKLIFNGGLRVLGSYQQTLAKSI